MAGSSRRPNRRRNVSPRKKSARRMATPAAAMASPARPNPTVPMPSLANTFIHRRTPRRYRSEILGKIILFLSADPSLQRVARRLPPPAPSRHQTQSGQAHTGPSHRSDRAVDVEARGGVRPGAAEGRNRQAVEARPVDAEAALWESGVAQRDRFEGEHPFVCWSPGRYGETPDAGYAPSEYQLKPW